MSIHRVLVLQSVEDSVTYFRKLRMEQSPYLKNYEFEHCYAVELTEEQQALPTPEMMEQVWQQAFEGGALLTRLERRVRAFDPDLLVAHAGFVFISFPEEMISVLKTLKEKFPRLRIAFEHGESLASTIPGFDAFFENSEEIRELVEHMF